MKRCSVSGCENKYRSIGLCSSHWKINKKFGTPTPVCWCGELSQTFAGNNKPSILCYYHYFLERFWENVDIRGEEECWEWQGSRTSGGYGVICYRGEGKYAHRLSLEFDNRPVPPRHHACHTCDNPPCVNPKHLYPGTPMDNMRDKMERGRQPKGETHYATKLSDDDVAEIRKLHSEGAWQADLARTYGVDPSHVSDIIRGNRR